MIGINKDWILLLMYAGIMGLQIFCAKIVSTNEGWQTGLTMVWGTAFIVMCVFVFPGFKPPSNISSYIIGIGAGLLAGLGTIIYYFVLQKSEATKVFPSMALMVSIGLLLSFIVLKEPFTIRKVIGCILSVIALILISI